VEVGRPYTSESISAEELSLEDDITRADIEFHGLDEAEASYEGRVFVNNPEAKEDTPPTPDNGYAGSFFVFGVHGGHHDSVGHQEGQASPFARDPRRAHAAKGRMVITATDLLKRAANAGQDVTVTVVPVNILTMSEDEVPQDVVKYDRLSIVGYRAEEPGEEVSE
jgi:hypothetical protein